MTGTLELTEEGNGPPIMSSGSDPMIGKELMHYRVVEAIGQGGMSVVYRGVDQQLKRDVAIKVLHPFLAEKSECRARLAREARAVARLEHQNILKIFDFSGEPTTLNERKGPPAQRGTREGFLVCELVRGTTLKEFAYQHRLHEIPEVGAYIVMQLADALAHAHENGVVHRDVKPENIMVRSDGALKLMDFGIAHVVDQKQLTVTGTLLGSPAHMAPECIEGETADEQSDLFSLGTVLYWLCTGTLPFEALTPHALLKTICEADFPPPQQRAPQISDDIVGVIKRSLARDPKERYASAKDMRDALKGVLLDAGFDGGQDKLLQILGGFENQRAELSSAILEKFLERSEELLDKGAKAKAFSVLGRVLASQPENKTAAALLQRGQDIDDEEPEVVVPAEASVPLELEPADAEPGLALAMLPGPRSMLLLGLLGAAIFAIVSIANWVDFTKPTSTPSTPTSDTENVSEQGMSVALNPLPAKPSEVKKTPVVNKVSPELAKKLRRDRSKMVALKPINPKSAADVTFSREVRVAVKPFATIFLDGKQVAKNALSATLKLTKGPHTLRFEHPIAKTKVVKTVVSEEGVTNFRDGASGPELRVDLDDSKPALLRVASNPPDAFVMVGKKLKGKADRSLKAPIIVPFGKAAAKHTFEITIYKKGYEVHVEKKILYAGRDHKLDVVLQPKKDADTNRPIAGQDPTP